MIDSPDAIATNALPARRGYRFDGNLDFVELRTRDHRGDFALRYFQVDNGAIANVSAATRQAIFIVAVSFEVAAPRFAPETLGNRAALDRHGRNGLSMFLELGKLAFCLSPILGYRHIGPPPEVAHPLPLLHRGI
jgi:hypothetical protein